MTLDWPDFARVLRRERLPAALVDLDAFDRNIDRLVAPVREAQKTLRVASKSVRHVGLLRRIFDRGGETVRGVLCFTLEEACFLRDQGFDDLLVAYPSVQQSALAAVAERVRAGATIRLVADDRVELEAYARAARDAQTVIEVVFDLDVAYQPVGQVHLGVQRSPLRSPDSLARLAEEARALEGIEIVGLMAYEAHVAGLPDNNPFSRAMNPIRRALKRLAVPQVAVHRKAGVDALVASGVTVRVVNGGGTGSVRSTSQEPCVTEVTAGSGFLCSHLFDYYVGNELEPAAFFALEVCRIPEPGIITCLGGGYIASGEPGWDRLPLPWRPAGLSYLSMEGAGEVQTPLRLAPYTPTLHVGDPVVFRHAKAGELAERFADFLLLSRGEIVGREPSYRGLGRCFL